MFEVRLFRTVLALVLAFMALLAWRAIYTYTCISLFIPLAVILIITFNMREYSVRHRRCLAECYFCETSIFYRFFNSRVAITILSFFFALVTGTILVLNMLTWSLASLTVLFIDIFLITLLFISFGKILNPTLRKETAPVVVKMWVSSINTVIVLLALVAVQYYSKFPPYLEKTIVATVEKASQGVGSSCALINTLAKLQIEKEAYGWWLMVKASSQMGDDASFKWAAWILFLLSGSLSIWAYSRYLVQITHLAYNLGDKDD